MKYINSPSPLLAPLIDMKRDRGRDLLRALPVMFAAFLSLLTSSAIYQSLRLDSASFTTVLQLLAIGLAAYAAIQMILENHLTLIELTYQRSTTSGDG